MFRLRLRSRLNTSIRYEFKLLIIGVQFRSERKTQEKLKLHLFILLNNKWYLLLPPNNNKEKEITSSEKFRAD
jgi:hypothetical protein